jgi:flagellar basal body-associated protein FliL
MKVLLIIFLVLLIIGGAAGYYFFVYKKQNQSCPTAIKSLKVCGDRDSVYSISNITCVDGSKLSDMKLKDGGKCKTNNNINKELLKQKDLMSGKFSSCSVGDKVKGYEVSNNDFIFKC